MRYEMGNSWHVGDAPIVLKIKILQLKWTLKITYLLCLLKIRIIIFENQNLLYRWGDWGPVGESSWGRPNITVLSLRPHEFAGVPRTSNAPLFVKNTVLTPNDCTQPWGPEAQSGPGAPGPLAWFWSQSSGTCWAAVSAFPSPAKVWNEPKMTVARWQSIDHSLVTKGERLLYNGESRRKPPSLNGEA